MTATAPVPLDTLTVALSWNKLPLTKRLSRGRGGELTKHDFCRSTSSALRNLNSLERQRI